MSATKFKTQAIEDNAITTPKIGDAQVTQQKLAPGIGGNVDHSFKIQTSGTNVPSDIETIMTWDEEQFDTDNLHDNAVNNSRVTITAPTAGKWLILGIIMFPNPPTATGKEGQVRITRNGAQFMDAGMDMLGPVFTGHTISVATLLNMAAGDYIEITVKHNYGTTQSIGGGLPTGRAFFEGIRIAT